MLKTVGITDEITSCDCCGKENLKRTVVMMDDGGNVAYYGSVCAGKHAGRPAKEIQKEAKNAVKQTLKEIEKFENTHPNNAKRREILQSLNERKLPFKERMSSPEMQEIRRLEKEIQEDSLTKFGKTRYQLSAII